MDVNGHAGKRVQGACVVKMPVGQQHRRGGFPIQGFYDPFALRAGIDHHRLAAAFVVYDVAVGGHIAHCQSVYLHGNSSDLNQANP